MAPRKQAPKPAPKKKEDEEKATLPGCVTHITDGTATITPLDPADTQAIAWLLLDAADTPTQVRTITSPNGWSVPQEVAEKAGLT